MGALGPIEVNFDGGPKAFPLFGEPLQAEASRNPLRIAAPPESLAALQEPASKAEASSMNPFRVAAWAEAFRRFPPSRASGRFPRPLPVRKAFEAPKSLSALPWKGS